MLPDTVESAIFKADRPESRKLYLAATAANSACSASAGVDSIVKGNLVSGEHSATIHHKITLIADNHVWHIYIYLSKYLSIYVESQLFCPQQYNAFLASVACLLFYRIS